MLKSLHIKLVLILVMLIVLVMAVTSGFLINSVTVYQISTFKTQMAEVFTSEQLDALNKNAVGEGAPARLKEIVSAYSGSLGIGGNRYFGVLDQATGDYLAGSNDELGQALEKTPNIISAMAGEVGDHAGLMEDYMDLAVPVSGRDGRGYIIYVKDNKQQLRDLNWMLFVITAQAMLFGLALAVILSFFLSKTMTTPIEDLTKSAASIASGHFTSKLEVHSDDEIGILTGAFNEMAQALQRSLEEAEGERNKLNTIFRHMADGVAAFLADGSLLSMNPAAERMLGTTYSPELKFSSVFPGVRVPYEVENYETDGQNFIVSDYEKNDRQLKVYFASFGVSEGENGLMAVIHDITEQSRLDAARREFVANVSHELRTPLTNIKSYTETLIDGGDRIEEETRQKFLQVVSGETDRMTHIVSDLLTLSKLDYQRLDLNIRRFSLKKLTERVYHAMLLTAKNGGCEMALEIDNDLPDIMGDPERIEQAVVNILSNAIKYTPAGGNVLLAARRKNENWLEVEVTDTGIGIPEKDMPRLFERFYRVDKARSRRLGGTGLGLSIAKELVERHRGHIEVTSVFGRGTTVTITLPVGTSADAEERT